MCFVLIILIINWCSAYSWHWTLNHVLNSSVAGLGNPSPTGVVLIHNKVRFIPLLVCMHFFIVHFIY